MTRDLGICNNSKYSWHQGLLSLLVVVVEEEEEEEEVLLLLPAFDAT